jgi:hypothetical protein
VSDANPMCFISITSGKSWWSWWRCSDVCDDHHHHPLMIIMTSMHNGKNYLLLKWHDIILVFDVSDANPMCFISITSGKSWWSWWRCSDDCDDHHHHHHHPLMISMHNGRNYLLLKWYDIILVLDLSDANQMYFH